MNIQQNFKNDIEKKKNTPMQKIDTPQDNNVKPPSPPMSVERIIIIVFTCVFAVMWIILMCLSIFTKILTPIAIESYMLIFISLCFLIFLIFSLINPNPSDDEDKEKKDFFNMFFQIIYYLCLVCGIVALVAFVIFNFIMFFGILGLIDLFDIIFNLISWIIFIPFSFLCLFYLKSIIRNLNKYIDDNGKYENPILQCIYFFFVIIIVSKDFFEEKIFTTLFNIIKGMSKIINAVIQYIYTNATKLIKSKPS